MSRTPLAVLLLAVAVAAGLAPPASADGRVPGRDRFVASARVVDVRPVYADVTIREPRLECTVADRRPDVRVYGARPEDRDAYRDDPFRSELRRDVQRDPYRDDRERYGVRRDGLDTDPRGAVVVGSLVGGAVGNRLTRDGSRAARAAGTVAGALVGAGAGRELVRAHDRRRGHGVRHGHGYGRDHDRGRGYGRHHARERCVRVVEVREERRLHHYDVTYVFRGRTFRAVRDRDPGDTIEIDVSVTPSRR